MPESHEAAVSRIFLSADLVGSTALKQRNLGQWLDDVLGFYQRFPSFVEESAADEETYDHQVDEPPELALWKAVGDELIFSCEIRSEHDVHLLVCTFLKAMRIWSDDVISGKAQLALKGGAWIATFPLPDRAIAVLSQPGKMPIDLFDPDQVPEDNNRSLLGAAERGTDPSNLWVDYVGPSMDTGFRVLGHATPRRFVVSLEVAWLYAAAGAVVGKPSEIYLHGEVQMKGIWGGRGYPLFWVDTHDVHDAQAPLDAISGVHNATFEQVRQVGQALCVRPDWPSKIYLPNTQSAALKIHHDQVLAEVARLGQMEDTSGEALIFEN